MTHAIQLSLDDPTTGERREPTLNLPVALGREFSQMPREIGGQKTSRMVLNSLEVSRFHASIEWENDSYIIIDHNSSNGLLVNGQSQKRCSLENGDILQIGPYCIHVSFVASTTPSPPPRQNSQIQFNPHTNIPDSSIPASPPVTPTGSQFPPPIFQQPEVSVSDLRATGLDVTDVNYLTIGAGLGSFVWADFLRLSGVKSSQIIAIGVDSKPYGRYKQLCLNSQIPSHERLRSNSDSCPDNIWGFPSYAWREAWHDLQSGKAKDALGYLWQVFSEPDFTQTYTPKAGNVFDSIDREAQRIQWENMFQYGSVRAIRKTTDGRYAVAYSQTTRGQRNHAFIVARYIHLATGYPAIKFLPDLQDYRQKTKDLESVVNAYEAHDHIYQTLEQKGGTVLIRGRGIVASRIIQRIYEARKRNSNIRLIHLMRSPKPQGNKFGKSQRPVEHHIEFQPFNWPKACWGGELRFQLEQADSDTRQRLISDWGGTTTADRHDWKHIVNEGISQGWYRIEFGTVKRVEKEPKGVITYIEERNYEGTMGLEANFIIDATGLDAHVTASPLLNDLVTHYSLPLNPLGRFEVSNEFEIEKMRSQQGKMYAAGTITLGGPYAAVDSFLGLQYVALRIVDAMAVHHAPGLRKLNVWTSLAQWLKWARNQTP